MPFSSSPQSFPASGSSPMNQLFPSGGQSIKSFTFSISPSNEYPGPISFKIDWFDLPTVQGTLRSLLQDQSLFIHSPSEGHLGHFQNLANMKKTAMSIPVLVFVVVQSPSCVQLFATPWTAAHQASLSLTISQSLPSSFSLHQ